MTSLTRYEFVLVAGPNGVNRCELVRVPRPAPSVDPDAGPALPLRIPFHPPPAARPSGWVDRYHTVLPGGTSTFVPEDWCLPDGEALRVLREAAGLSQREAAAVGDLHCGLVSELERGKRRAGKGIAAERLSRYVTALEDARR